MMTRLPKRLAYLSPAIEQLARIAPDELNEDNEIAFSLINDAIRQRVAGLTEAKAKGCLEQDAAALDRWLAQPGSEQSPAHYLSGVLRGILGFVGIGQLLGNEPDRPLTPPICKAIMAVPDGFECTEDSYGMILKRGDLQITIMPFTEPPWTLMIEQPAELLAPLGIVDTKVSFGDTVKGKKRLSVINRHVFLKTVGYVLEVPGGWINITAQDKRDFDESILESRFHTLQVFATEAG